MPAENKPIPLSEVYFREGTRLPGFSGSYNHLIVGEKPSFGWGSSTEYVKSLYLVGRTVLLNGQYYMPLDAGQITWYKF